MADGMDWGLATAKNPNAYDALDSLKSIGDMALQRIQGQAQQASTAATQQETSARQFALGQAQGQAAARPGIAAAAGKGDYTGAAQQALATGDNETFAGVRNLHSDDLDKMNREAGAMGDAALTLGGLPQEQRAAAFAGMAPQLKQAGFADHELAAAGGDLSDAKLTFFQNHALGAKTAIENEQKTRQLGIEQQNADTEQQNANTSRFSAHSTAAYQQGELQTSGWKELQPGAELHYVGPGSLGAGGLGAGGGDTFSRMVGAESGGSQFAGDGKTPLTSGKGAIGIAQIMPSTGPEAARAAGVAWDPQRFRTDAAYNQQLGRAYYASLVQRYGGDENKAVAAYNAGPGRVDAAVARGGGGWVAQLPAETKAYLAKVQPGGGVPGVITNTGGGSGGAGGLTKEAIQEAAGLAIQNGGQVPPGFARNRAAQAAIQNEVARQAGQMGLSPTDLIHAKQDQHGAAAMVIDMAKGASGKIVQSGNVAVEHLAQLRAAVIALHNGDVPTFNKLSQTYRQATGSPIPTNAAALRGVVANEIQKAVSGSAGALHDRQDLNTNLNTAGSNPQMLGAINGYIGLMGSQVRGVQTRYQAATGRSDFAKYVSPQAAHVMGIQPGGASGGARTPPAGATRTATGPGGQKVALVGGRWVQF